MSSSSRTPAPLAGGRQAAPTGGPPRRWEVPASTDRSYDIRICEPLLAEGNPALAEAGPVPGRRFVVIDSGLPQRRREQVQAYFAARGVTAHLMAVPGGRGGSTVETATAILTELRRFGLARRSEPVIAIGGRAVLNTAGFAASVYRRGVPFVRVPSSLLGYLHCAVSVRAQIAFDGADGLITGIAGPKLVLADRGLFGSLPPRAFASGLGELLRLAFACDQDLFGLLDSGAADLASGRLAGPLGLEVLGQATRALLSASGPGIFHHHAPVALTLGHTFAPVFEEAIGSSEMGHGQAAALEANLLGVIAARRGLLSRDALHRLAGLTERLGLPTAVPGVTPQAAWAALVRQQAGTGWPLVPLPHQIGECAFVSDLAPDEVLAALRELRDGHFATSISCGRPQVTG